MTLLSVENLSVKYGAISALEGLNLEVHEGELIALVGSNGAGKTTTLSAIAGVHKPHTGTVTFAGEVIHTKRSAEIARKGISLVPEDRGMFPSLTIAENLRLGSYFQKDKQRVDRQLSEIYDRFPILQKRADQGAGTLSGGEQQQLAIARALLTRPRLLMLDEPSLGLSPTLVDSMFELIEELHAEGVTILLVEQNVSRALEIADRAYLLTTGRLTATGTPQEMTESIDIAAAYLGGAASSHEGGAA